MTDLNSSSTPSTPPRVHVPIPFSPSESSLFTKVTPGTMVTDKMLKACAELFSNNYGVWGPQGFRPGERVKMTPSKLRQHLKGVDELIAHAFVTIWDYSHQGSTRRVAWVTQLVVDSFMRQRYIATCLLQHLKSLKDFPSISAIGLVSSQPAAVQALAKYIPNVTGLDLDFIKSQAHDIFSASPIEYLRPGNMNLRGSLFESAPAPGVISAVNTQFFVDHTEPLQVLEKFQRAGRWYLGDLPEGHEFLIICPLL